MAIRLSAILLAVIFAFSISAYAKDQPRTKFDFEDGTLQGWKIISGSAGRLPVGPGSPRPDVKFNMQGDYFIGLWESPDRDNVQVVLQSPTFEIKANTMTLLVGAGDHRDSCYIALYKASDNSEIYRETGCNTEEMSRRYWDVSKLRDEKVYLKLVDANTGTWGHLNVDDIRELTPKEDKAFVDAKNAKIAAYKKWLASAAAPAKRIVYSGKALQDIAMPMGGMGSGHLSICGDGAVRQWQFFNKVNDGCIVPDSFFAIWTKSDKSGTNARLLQQTTVSGLPPVNRVEFIGEYPFAELKYSDPALPVQVSSRVFSPQIPMNSKESGIPAVAFEFTIENRGNETVQVSLLSSLQNAAGYDGVSAIKEVANKDYGGNVNTPISSANFRGLLLSNPSMKTDARQFGTMCVGSTSREAVLTPCWNNTSLLWSDFSKDGAIDNVISSAPSPAGVTYNAAVTVPITLAPGQKAVVPFIWAWHFPNHYVWWDGREGQPKIGRMYSNWFADASKAAEYLADNYTRLSDNTEKFRRTFYKTTLPYWMLDRISAQSSTLVSNVAMWLEDGSFTCFEGSGCCPMNCTHVWNYEQQLAHLFPDLERNMRRADLEVQQKEDGGIRHRIRLPFSLPRETDPFVDGHLGTILKCYREYRLSSDRTWLDKEWPRIKLAMQFVLNQWDPNQDGVLVNEQWNTYDAAMYGPNTFIGTLYLAALRASEEMAKIEKDTDFAAKMRTVYNTGAQRLDEVCWNGEYYLQIEEKPTESAVGENKWLLEDWPVINDVWNVNRPYGKGCHSDQLLGQWWADNLDLGYLLPKDRVNSSLSAIMKYNWVQDFGTVKQTPRAFAGTGDPGLYNCSWPNGGQPKFETMYSFEAWTGIEYEVAGLMLYEGRINEAYQIVKACSDRYNGAARAPIARNPWAEVECSNHYARAMSAWAMLLAAQGYKYCGPDQSLEFNPIVSPSNHASFFTSAEGWGLFTQKRSGKSQDNVLEVDYGKLNLKTFTLHLPKSADTNKLKVKVNGREIKYVTNVTSDVVQLQFQQPLTIKADQKLIVSFTW